MTTYATTITTQSEATVLAALLARLGAEGVKTAGLGDFSAELATIRLTAKAIAEEQALRAALARAISLAEAALAGRSFLEAVALGRYNETPIPAAKAVWFVEVTNLIASPVTFAPFELQAEGLGQLFQNTQSGSIPVGSSSIILFEALAAGQAGNVPVGAIDTLRKGKAGLGVANTELNTAGRDAESSPAFVARCLSKWGVLGRGGNRAAYDYLIPTGVPTITRWKIDDANPAGPGSVAFRFANAAGPATSGEVLAEGAYLGPKKPIGSGRFLYLAAIAVNVGIACELVTDGTNPAAADQAAAALIRLASAFPLGPETLQEELVKGVLMGGAYAAYGLEGIASIRDLRELTFTTDQPIATGRVLTITPTITQV